MQKFFILAVSIFILSACSKNEEQPTFKSVYGLDLGNVTKKTARLAGTAVFKNASDKLTYTIKSFEIDFKIDGVDVGTYIANDAIKIQTGADVSLSFNYPYATDKFINDDEDPSDSYTVELSGTVQMISSEGEKIKVPFSHKETVKVNVKKLERKEERQLKREEKKAEREAQKAEKKKK